MKCFLRSPPFFFYLKIYKDCTARVAWQLHQAVCVDSLCVDDVVDLEMLGLSCELRSVAFHTMLSSLASFGNTLHICNRDDDDCGFTCTVAESQKWIHWLLFAWVAFISQTWRDAEAGWNWTVDASDRRFSPSENLPRPGESGLPDPVLTLSLPDWTHIPDIVHQQSCQHLYCMTILRERFWCFVTLQILSCVCVTYQCPESPPHPPKSRSHTPD